MINGTKIRGALQRIGTTFFISVPSELLSQRYTARPARVESEAGWCRARLLRRESGEVVLMLPPQQFTVLGLKPDAAEVELTIGVYGERMKLNVPDDLKEALRDNGLRWETLSERDRHQAVTLVQEARAAESRRARIAAIIAAIREQQ